MDGECKITGQVEINPQLTPSKPWESIRSPDCDIQYPSLVLDAGTCMSLSHPLKYKHFLLHCLDTMLTEAL